jgi:uncharacterized protein YwqG
MSQGGGRVVGMEPLDESLLREYLGIKADTVLLHREPSIRLIGAGPAAAAGRGSRFGGRALLPPGMQWPYHNDNPLSFLGEIRMGEDLRLSETAPRLLTFFYDLIEEPWGFDPAHAGGWRVIPVDPETAEEVDAPQGTESFETLSLAPRETVTVPDLAEPVVAHLFAPDWTDARAYWRAVGDSEEPRHRMFGWPDLIQNPMQLECQLATNGISAGGPEGFRDPRVEQLRDGAADWRLLLQIDSDDDAGWMWGDVGRLYFWIRDADLRAGRFDKVWMIQQCF